MHKSLLVLLIVVGCALGTVRVPQKEYATNASEKAVADVAKKQVADAMKQFRRDLDAQLQTAGNGIIGTISAIAGNPTFTLSSTPFGARLVRENQVCQIYDSTVTTNRGTVLVTNRQQSLGLTQTVTLQAGTCPLANIQITDVILPDGLNGASPVGLYGIPYHHNLSASGTWMGISRANPYAQADLVNANGNGFALPFVRLAKHKIMQNIGIEEAEALKSLRWYAHPAQQAAYHEIAFSVAMLNKTGGDQNFDMMFSSESIGGIKPIWNPHADETRMDLLNLETWGRVEWKEIDYLEIGGQTVNNRRPSQVTAKCEPSLIDLDGENPNRAEGVSHGERLSEKASQRDGAIVRTCGNTNRKSTAEMTVPAQAVTEGFPVYGASGGIAAAYLFSIGPASQECGCLNSL